MELTRLFNTVRHLRARQLIYQLYYRLRPNWRPRDNHFPTLSKASSAWIESPRCARSLVAKNTLQIFGRNYDIASPVGWNAPDASPLIVYNLHYFDALRGDPRIEGQAALQELIEYWIRENPPIKRPGWDAYPTSQRIVNWIKWHLTGNQLSEIALRSLFIQARMVRRNVEWHLMGNHLLANAKALLFAGLFFAGEEPRQWYRYGLYLLRREIAEQILNDGGHYERSPMYHSLILEDLLDLYNILSVFGSSEDVTWAQQIVQMLKWLNEMCHPDGQICLFNDAAINVARSPADLNSYANRLGLAAPPDFHNDKSYLKDTGYIRKQQGNVTVFFDIGPLGPDYNPGHAHADTLSFELSMRGHRVIVDTGTSEYTPLDVRTTERSTAAHNTIQVDGNDSSEVWSTFRVARRARVYSVQNHSNEIAAEHDGFSHFPGVGIHRRKLQWHENQMVIYTFIRIVHWKYTATAT